MKLSIENNKSICIFCNGQLKLSYCLNGYDIHSCTACNTFGVHDIPSDDYLFLYYQGFSFQINENNLIKIKNNKIKNWMESFLNKTPSKMLDIGGGGGFFAKAFEEFGLGEATYLDLDESACTFAKEKMNLDRVFHASIDSYLLDNQDAQFDIIYARHVIEHLIDPVSFVNNCTKLLLPSGTLIIQCPNGTSKEGLFYPAYWWKFLRKVAHDNNWNKPYALAYSITSKYAWSIDPPRHLWAISHRGFEKIFSQDPNIQVKTSTASLADSIYSPYWKSNTVVGKVRDRICNCLFGSIFSGMHLIAIIKKRTE